MTVSNYVLNPVINCADSNASKILLVAPLSIITRAIDTIIGVGATLASIATVGKIGKVIQFAAINIRQSEKILTTPYKLVLNALNPEWKESDDAWVERKGQGLLSSIALKIIDKAEDCAKSDNKFVRHVFSRSLYALTLIACTVARIADAIIGVTAGILSIATLGKIKTLNNIAYRGLHAPGILKDIPMLLLFTVNPWPED